VIDRFSFLPDIAEGWQDSRVAWAEAQGWSEQDIARDRVEAVRMVREGLVRPNRAA